MADSAIVTLEFPQPEVAVLSLCDPDKGANVLLRSVLDELEEKFAELAQRTELAGLVIRSTKPGSFIAGADLREFAANIDEPVEKVKDLSHAGQRLFAQLAEMPFVTIAAIEGICLGGGSELAIWCDRRIMVRDGRTNFGFPEVKLGLFPGWGGTARTPRMIGLSNAIELITGGEPVDVDAAWGLGLADDTVNGALLAESRGANSNPTERPDALLAAAVRMIRAEHESQQYLADRQRWSKPLKMSDTELAFLAATASAYIQGKTNGHYPAPLAALEAMIGAAGVNLAEACEIETEQFAPLWGSPVNRALLHVFFLQDGNKRQSSKLAEQAPQPVKSAAVVGAGVMGQGIAAANAKRGLPVALADVDQEAVARGVEKVVATASFSRELKGPDPKTALKIAPLVNGTIDDDEIAVADFIVEAIYENAEAKQTLYARLEPKLADHAVLATNTSTIPIEQLAAGLKHPERFCGLHFFNPVHRMPLVEVIRGPQSSDATIATSVAYSLQLGKSPIVVRDGPGFVVNRVLLPYMNEALLLLAEGASIKQVERSAKNFGMPMGPIELYDTVGLDVALHAGRVLENAFADRIEPSPILPALVDAGRLGKKVGKGFFDYSGKKQKPAPSAEVETLLDKHRTAPRKVPHDEVADRLVLPMLLEATRIVDEGIVASGADLDLALIYGIGFPPFRGGVLFWADEIGSQAILERLAPLEKLGPRFTPTGLLERAAQSGERLSD